MRFYGGSSSQAASSVDLNEEFKGLYVPKFSKLNLSAATGLAIHASGGLVAAVDNVSGSGYLNLPEVIDRTKKWRWAVKFQLNDARQFSVQLCDAANDFRKAAKIQGSVTNLTMTVGGTTYLNQFGNGVIPAGSIYWLTQASDGNKVTTAVYIETPTSISNSSAFQDSAYQKLFYRTDAFDAVNGAVPFFTALSRINITNASTTNKILGVFVNIGSLAGPKDSQFDPAFVLQPVVLNDSTCWVMANGGYGGKKKSNLVFVHHPNGNPGDIVNQPSAFPTIQKLWANGYTVIGMSGIYGAHSDFLEPTASNWGSPAGLRYRKALVEWVRTNMPLVDNMYHLGLSMGAVNALQYESMYPGSAKAAVLISGAVDLSDSYTNRGFSGQIQKGYGKWYVCIQAGTGQAPASSPTFWTPLTLEKEKPDDVYYSAPYVWRHVYSGATAYSVNDIVSVSSSGAVGVFADSDPTLNVDRFKDLPVHLRHGASDATIPSSQMTTFANNLAAAGGSVEQVSVSGGTHLGATVYDPDAILSFFDRFR